MFVLIHSHHPPSPPISSIRHVQELFIKHNQRLLRATGENTDFQPSGGGERALKTARGKYSVDIQRL